MKKKKAKNKYIKEPNSKKNKFGAVASKTVRYFKEQTEHMIIVWGLETNSQNMEPCYVLLVMI